MKKIAVILSGSGVFDGSEIHEATLSLLAIAKNNAQYECFAPDIEQHHVINHITGKEMNDKRNVLIESARIARGKINPLNLLNEKNFDALVLPGGFGAAKNLSDFAFKGQELEINNEVSKVISSFHSNNKPIAALCISPVILAKLIPDCKVTIGSDEATIKAIEFMGATHQATTHGEVLFDEKNKIITTPCYMLDANITQIETGVNNAINKLIDFT